MKTLASTRCCIRRAVGLVGALTLLVACAQRQLVPSPQADLVPGHPLTAAAQNKDVRIIVRTGAWAAPGKLDQKFTPLHVSIDNHGRQPLRVSYADFIMETGTGMRYTPLPPLLIERSVPHAGKRPVQMPRPHFEHGAFFVAPWYMTYYPGIYPWPHPWAFDSHYYTTYYPRWQTELPTRRMIDEAIPEGVIAAGGSIAGFLYFPELSAEVKQVTLRVDVMQGNDGRRLGRLELPFVLR